jgi:phospholipase C
MTNFMRHNRAETIFDRLEQHGKTWKVYVLEPDPISFTGFLHMERLRDRFATNFVPFAEFERDAAEGTLPDFSLIEPNLLAGHCDYHPAFGRALLEGVDVLMDPPSSVSAGEAFLGRIYDAVRTADSPAGSNAFNTLLFVGFDEPGGTYDHVPPGPVSPPQPGAPPGQLGFTFDRSGYRVPAVIVSPWIEEGSVYAEEYRHTSMLATLRQVWDLGSPFTARDAAARSFQHVLRLDTPRGPDSWPEVTPLPVPAYQEERVAACQALGAGSPPVPRTVRACQAFDRAADPTGVRPRRIAGIGRRIRHSHWGPAVSAARPASGGQLGRPGTLGEAAVHYVPRRVDP